MPELIELSGIDYSQGLPTEDGSGGLDGLGQEPKPLGSNVVMSVGVAAAGSIISWFIFRRNPVTAANAGLWAAGSGTAVGALFFMTRHFWTK